MRNYVLNVCGMLHFLVCPCTCNGPNLILSILLIALWYTVEYQSLFATFEHFYPVSLLRSFVKKRVVHSNWFLLIFSCLIVYSSSTLSRKLPLTHFFSKTDYETPFVHTRKIASKLTSVFYLSFTPFFFIFLFYFFVLLLSLLLVHHGKIRYFARVNGLFHCHLHFLPGCKFFHYNTWQLIIQCN